MENLQGPVVTNSREDPLAYRIAVGTLGVALVAFLIGAAVIAAGGKPVPTQYWTTGSSIAGALLGILAPTPTKTAAAGPRGLVANIAVAVKDLWTNRALLLLLVVFIASVVLGVTSNSPELLGVAGAAGGALIGLLAPPPTSGGTGNA
ncbi:MAG TPA: hypothetical protein VG388_07875 [Solirubrobacteraceae bacterium]|jgi:Na+/melibiose symporter-like transporter|nr:hypothetical protein [Solirubrobacteraceae bacterium]